MCVWGGGRWNGRWNMMGRCVAMRHVWVYGRWQVRGQSVHTHLTPPKAQLQHTSPHRLNTMRT